ncbi:hypothetical protein DEFDS_P067 (plasmid) [Deferribacter desulfuricans SSM1]|uniref:Uncharacterized protein n=1 Tax=Deferribacter desulfuricans (strain DSM 14783 / JCM 11476 / NBRC 101012 / SSM1) TaxID=639282 RepID=D3PEP9_DEFDS|nr:hypothetical protein [Deferribacter desulfuricans]BAI81691.1 hypothetical protein DEFDS_P067 [Deferribacter desulfuricans SSM1]
MKNINSDITQQDIIDNFQNLYANFLQKIDNLIQDNLDNITSNTINHLYYLQFNLLKNFKGNSSGFTGLSEFLIVRFIIHYITKKYNQNFKLLPITKDIKYWQSQNFKINVQQTIKLPKPVKVGNKKQNKIQPDIIIKKENKIISYIEIKIYLKDFKILEDLIKKYEVLLENNKNNYKLLFILFNGNDNIMEKLDKYKLQNTWFNYIVLNKSNKKFIDAVNKIV